MSDMLSLWGDDDKPTEGWREHWQGMPEFVQEKQEPFATLILRVETEDDLRELSARLGQKLTPKTKSIWFPYRPHQLSDKRVWRSAE